MDAPQEIETKHPLQHAWTFWYDNNTGAKIWGENLKPITSFSTVEDFWGIYNVLAAPSALKVGSDYHLFRDGIEPKWEDAANRAGGKWVLVVAKSQKNDVNTIWLNTLLSLIGNLYEEENEICGAVVSVRKTQDKISLWTRTASNRATCESIGRKLRDILQIPETRPLVYSAHDEAEGKGGSGIQYKV